MTVVAFGSDPWAPERATVDELLAIIEPPAWHADAACKEAPPEIN